MSGDVDLARRALLQGRPRGATVYTPPWARSFGEFADACTRCGDCLAACPERILVRGSGGFPAVDFTSGACTFCGTCVSACPTGALSATVDPPWQQAAVIADTCLAHQGIYCQSCRDPCAVSAITFIPTPGRVPRPKIDPHRCTGCGGCVAVCPSAAVTVMRPEEIR